MIEPTVASAKGPGTAAATRARPAPSPGRLGPSSIPILSAWCGLVAGLLEVATIVVRKSTFDVNHLYGMTRHFVWLIPLIDLGLFLALGIVLDASSPGSGRDGAPGWPPGCSCAHLAPAGPGRLSEDLWLGLVPGDARRRRAAGPGP